ncbi:MAG TPA: hydroxypyruvate isomerase [Clostridiales bacterium]|nr:hydroxypyruvate isomerase [Clostridiales bacterium]
MPKISLCLETVFPELKLADRIRKAADAGFQAVEFWDPSSADLSGIAAAAAACNVAIVGCTLSEPRVYQMDRQAGPVVANVRKSVAIARELGCPTLIGLSSDLEGHRDSQKNILIENLKRVADIVAQAGVTLVLEPLNSLVDHKGCYLDSAMVGFEIVKCVDCPNIKLLFDIYHMQIMEGNLVTNITPNIGLVGHFHTAGVPGRHEPYPCEVNYPFIMKKIDELGYQRYVGLEYWPTYDHARSIRDSRLYLSGQEA